MADTFTALNLLNLIQIQWRINTQYERTIGHDSNIHGESAMNDDINIKRERIMAKDKNIALKKEMEHLIASIRAGKPLQVSERTRELATQVAEMKKDTRSVEEWAKRLAGDVSDATD